MLRLVGVTQDKSGKETNGFKSRMGARAPAPRLLRLKPEDQPLLQKEPLRQGKFTWVTEAGREERWIVASCGNYTVLWNFRYIAMAVPTVTCSPSCCIHADMTLKQKQTCKSDPGDSADCMTLTLNQMHAVSLSLNLPCHGFKLIKSKWPFSLQYLVLN